MNARNRVMIGILGLDQHDFGAKVVGTILRKDGFEVIYVGKFQTPESLAKAAIEEDVDAIAISCHSWEYLDYVPQLINLLRENRMDIPVVVGGGTISEADEAALRSAGVSDVLRSGSTSEEIVRRMRRVVAKRSGMRMGGGVESR
jgi:methylmalonyl-CoA mutase C-terminal domain/subunit